jgi:release factor glutamine methyltransferase
MLNHVSVHVRRSDLFSALGEEAMFDLIVSNPPWVPSATDDLPQSGMARAWDAGQDGRALIDPICAQAPPTFVPLASCCVSSQ